VLAFVTALAAEAKPLIARFQLQRIDAPLPLYKKDDLYLVVSGMGKVSSAIATTFLQTKMSSIAAYVNVGIAGHASLPIGTSIMASKIIDPTNGSTFYPTFLTAPFCTTQTVCCTDSPEFTFSTDAVYDMESIGFAQAAAKFSSSEFIHCYKVISDNLSSLATIDPEKAEGLIVDHLPQIQELTKLLREQLQKTPSFSKIPLTPWKERWHFTQTQEHQLQRLLQRFDCLQQNVCLSSYATLYSAKQVLASLETDLQSLPPIF